MFPRVHPPRSGVWVLCIALLSWGAAATARTIDVAAGGPGTGLTLRSQGAAGVELHYRMGTFGLEPVEIDGRALEAVTLPGVLLPNDAGAPDLPSIGRLVAIPRGATASVTVTASQRRVFAGIDVAPAPVIPFENQTGPLTYTRNPALFERDAYYPDSPVVISAPRKLRGVDVVVVGITPFQYNPVQRELVAYTDLTVRVEFSGGNGQFGEERLRNRHWESLLREQILNYASLPAVDFDSAPDRARYGWEYVILCPNEPAFTAWADTLKSWRTLQGISTEVFTTSQTGTTAAQIEAWLNTAYTTWEVPPAAFLILGDYPDSGDRTPGVTSPIWNNYCVSDNIYADVDDDDLPDMVHGRICARNAAELETTIRKMLDYERTPPTDEGFYDHPLIAGGWQTERWFILCCEVILGHQANVLGKHPVREYAIYEGAPGSLWSTNVNTPAVVDYFGPAGLGYIPLTPEHLNDWEGDAEGINAAINAGAYIVVHRDHGFEGGWGEPEYSIEHLSGLHNDKLPFVFTLNCLTGKYNAYSTCFSEALHRMEHGALGLIGASETSYSFVNDAFAWGLFDCMWPGFMPDYPTQGGDNLGAPDMRPAFGMAYGKYFLEQSSWPSNPNNKEVTYHLFHHFGDAFLTLLSEVPQPLDVYHYDACPLDADLFAIRANEGAVIALTVDGEIIGVADATGAIQQVPIIPQTEPGTLRITVTQANHYRYDTTIPIGGALFTVRPDGTGTYPTIQAAIDAAVGATVIELASGVYTGPGNRDLDYLGKPIEIRSHAADPDLCVIDCQGTEVDMHRGFYLHRGETTASRLCGVTIRNGSHGAGGALYCEGAALAVANCVFAFNEATSGGAVGLHQSHGSTFTDCVFRSNEAYGGSGGAILLAEASAACEGCTFAQNVAWDGAAIEAAGAQASCAHCTFYDNAASAAEGGQLDGDAAATLTLESSIVALSTSQAVHLLAGAGVALTCCDLYGNTGGDWVGPIAGQYGAAGNFSEDPLFCDAPALDLTVSSASFCAPGNHPECERIGAWGVGCAPPTFAIAPDGSGDYPTIQAAVEAAPTGTTIELLDGIYTGDGNRDVDLQDKRVLIRSRSGDAAACVIDCEGSVVTPHRGFVIDGGQDFRTQLANLTVENGLVSGTEAGGGLYVGPGCSPTVNGCAFLACSAAGDGGAVALGGSATLQGCTLAGNGASRGGGLYAGGGAAPAVAGCTFHGNGATEGGALYADDGAVLAVDHTILHGASAGAAAACGPTGAIEAACCDVYGNEGGDWVGCLEGQLGSGGNLAADPWFCDAAGGVFTLYDNSPCASENNPECGQIGAHGVGCLRPLFVKPDGTGTHPTIQAAIDDARSGMVIELDDGVFRGPGNRDINPRAKEVTIRSRSGDPSACIIDAQGTLTSQHVAFFFQSGEGEDMAVEGVTMTGGYYGMGGAVYISSSSPVFRRCVFSNNRASGGGAVYAAFTCAPRFTECTFSHNAGSAGMGGAFFLNDNANVVLENCLITFSQAGAAFNIIMSSPVFTCCDIYGNAGGDWTGTIAGQLGIQGNICTDPIYCDGPAFDFTLDETSPCAPENNPECGLMGALGVGCYSSDVAEGAVPAQLLLAADVPSSAGGLTAIRYAIPGTGTADVHLGVYDAAGRLVCALVDGPQTPGTHTLAWDGRAANGARAGSGVYFCRLVCNGETRTRNLVLVR